MAGATPHAAPISPQASASRTRIASADDGGAGGSATAWCVRAAAATVTRSAYCSGKTCALTLADCSARNVLAMISTYHSLPGPVPRYRAALLGASAGLVVSGGVMLLAALSDATGSPDPVSPSLFGP